ncbi:MAG: VTT domain-containing protein [Gemmatimonadetes bacterium]|nr:VTT domain-containing protein [Gemmatimonadota bacterium]
MENLDAFLSSYGYWVFFAVGFAEFVGVPIVSVPVLIGAGALVASGTLGFWGVVVSVAAGGWLADLGWYTLGRRQGSWLIDVACGLSSNPMACVSTVKDRLSRLGTPYILLAKMLPGSGNLIAVAAGLAGFGALPFILADAAALILWAAIYTGTGWILSDQVAPAIEWVVTYNRTAVLVLLLIVLAAAFRLWKMRLHQEMHRRMDPTPLA